MGQLRSARAVIAAELRPIWKEWRGLFRDLAADLRAWRNGGTYYTPHVKAPPSRAPSDEPRSDNGWHAR